MNDDERQERIALIKARHRREVGYDYDEAGRRLEGDPECHFDEQDWPCDTAWLLSELDAATARAERAENVIADAVSVGEMQGVDWRLQPWSTLRAALAEGA